MNARMFALTVVCAVSGGLASAGTLAHWNFDSQADFNAGVATDITGNGNTLMLNQIGNPSPARMAEFSTETYATPYANTGAVRFHGTKNGTNGLEGSYFQTVASAPINSMVFENGYTIEAMFKVPAAEFNAADHAWMGGFTRTGKPSGDAPATFTISNLGEVQWHTQEYDPGAATGREESAWSYDLDQSDVYHHVAFVNYLGGDNNWHVDMYVDGFLGSRNVTNADHNGIEAYDDGRWNVGLGIWANGPDALWNGWIDDIRVSDTVLTPSEFTMFTPEPTSALLALAGVAFVLRRRGA
jgi:hypothetical protein